MRRPARANPRPARGRRAFAPLAAAAGALPLLALSVAPRILQLAPARAAASSSVEPIGGWAGRRALAAVGAAHADGGRDSDVDDGFEAFAAAAAAAVVAPALRPHRNVSEEWARCPSLLQQLREFAYHAHTAALTVGGESVGSEGGEAAPSTASSALSASERRNAFLSDLVHRDWLYPKRTNQLDNIARHVVLDSRSSVWARGSLHSPDDGRVIKWRDRGALVYVHAPPWDLSHCELKCVLMRQVVDAALDPDPRAGAFVLVGPFGDGANLGFFQSDDTDIAYRRPSWAGFEEEVRRCMGEDAGRLRAALDSPNSKLLRWYTVDNPYANRSPRMASLPIGIGNHLLEHFDVCVMPGLPITSSKRHARACSGNYGGDSGAYAAASDALASSVATPARRAQWPEPDGLLLPIDAGDIGAVPPPLTGKGAEWTSDSGAGGLSDSSGYVDRPQLLGLTFGGNDTDAAYGSKGGASANKPRVSYRGALQRRWHHLFTSDTEATPTTYAHSGTGALRNTYMRTLQSAKYVPAPLGYGADSYRVWEALLLGAVPVVERRGFEDLFEGLPVLVVDNLFTDVSKYLLENEYHHVRCPKDAVSEEGAGGVRRHKWGKLTRSYWVRQMLADSRRALSSSAAVGAGKGAAQPVDEVWLERTLAIHHKRDRDHGGGDDILVGGGEMTPEQCEAWRTELLAFESMP